ncbi:MAG: hypothetical protein F6K54_06935 [Okeania sp. SIO3B5]|uniref:hypothetical protein n=1 Tax=Okeania sp. SIO3B5 TaxID=2607811 RepID=UPI0013FEA92E|nr:hypothetical protein [Okeania sp. SIO3B5]NEO52837.1 hypothetical protein [Okeania sp. SIO3B5]NEO52838.1 hypothetical protein [Okeania sp. SIO3B5]
MCFRRWLIDYRAIACIRYKILMLENGVMGGWGDGVMGGWGDEKSALHYFR